MIGDRHASNGECMCQVSARVASPRAPMETGDLPVPLSGLCPRQEAGLPDRRALPHAAHSAADVQINNSTLYLRMWMLLYNIYIPDPATPVSGIAV